MRVGRGARIGYMAGVEAGTLVGDGAVVCALAKARGVVPARAFVTSAGVAARDALGADAVSYTHLTLPTKRIV